MLSPNRVHISQKDLVLEVGSGHQPYFRSDVLCDKYLSNQEREGDIVTDRPFVLAAGEALPFKDQIFDYVICSHVIEHAEDPGKFLDELSRVAPRGYIEAPSMIWEKLHPSRSYHRWFILCIDDTLVFVKKEREDLNHVFGVLFEYLNSQSLEYRLFVRRFRNLFFIRYQWEKNIKYQIDPSDSYFRSFFIEPWTKKQCIKFVPQSSFSKQLLKLLVNLFSGTVDSILRKSIDKSLKNLVRKTRNERLSCLNLQEILACPKCRSGVAVLETRIECHGCGMIYRKVNGIPDMVLDHY